MSDENIGGSNVEISSEPISTEIGSGAVEDAVVEEAGLAREADGAAVDELAENIEEAVEDGASDEEIKEMIETFKFKANGQDKEVTLDWNNKEDIIKRLQMAEAAQPAMQKAAEIEKNFERELQSMVDDPWAALEALGLDPDDLAEQRIQDRISHLQKSPDQLAQEQRDTELEELRQKLKDQDTKQEEQEFALLQQEAEIDLDNQITEALSSTAELPKSPYVVKRIADAMLTAVENGHPDVTAKDVLPWVEKEINEEMQALFSSMPEKLLENYIGQKNIERLRKGRLNKMTQSAAKIKESGKQAPIEKKADRNIKLNDWLKHGSSLGDL